MAFALNRLSVVAYADGFTLWHYRAEGDSAAAIGATGYFAPAAHMMHPGDMVITALPTGVEFRVLLGAGPPLRATAV